MESLPSDLQRIIWSYLTVQNGLGRINTVIKGCIRQGYLLKTWRIARNLHICHAFALPRVIPSKCVSAECGCPSSQFINLIWQTPSMQLHYCGNCLSELFLKKTSPLYEKYILIMDMTVT